MAALVYLCFFVSGAASLVFELIWTRGLERIFGATSLAIATVVAVFMGGLALGSALAGRHADRARAPLRTYAFVEAGVGLYALAVPAILARYPALNPLLGHLAGAHPIGLAALRFVATAAVLLVPTTLMGATLPLVARHLSRTGISDGRVVARRVGALYAWNTLGAVVGTALAGFVLMPRLGERATSRIAASLDLALAAAVLMALFVGARRRPRTVDELAVSLDDLPDPEADETAAAPTTAAQKRVALGAFAASGATSMVYQVLWSRALAIVIGSSVYSFTLVLLAFLVGISGGAAVGSRIAKTTRRPSLALALDHLGLVLAVAFSIVCIDKLPGSFIALLKASTGAISVDEILSDQFLLAALPIIPATLFMGATLPLTMRVLSSGGDHVGHDVGRAYAWNTVGAIAGSVGAGFLVLPIAGLDRGLRLATVASAIVAAALVSVSELRSRARRAVALFLVAAAVLAATLVPRWDLAHFQAGLFRVSIARDIVESGKWQVGELLYYQDGLSTTVSVERWGKVLALKNNGKVDASNGDDMPTQIMVGLMPFLFHPTAMEKPPRVAVVGFGSGVTIGAVTQFPIGHADVVELEPAVVEASHFFDSVNHTPLTDPRVHLVVDDGRNFLAGGKDLYDVIISEPSNPWITGVSNLFTRDYWTLAKARLADDGVFCQWAQLYELDAANVKTILRTFAEVFPYTYVFSAEDLSSDLILVAAKRPLALNRAELARFFAVQQLQRELARGDVRSPDDVIAYLLLAPEELAAFTAGADLNTDDNARIEFAAPRDLLRYLRYDSYLARVYGETWPYGRFERHLTGLGDGNARAQAEAELAETLVAHGKRAAAQRVLARAHHDAGGAWALTEGPRAERLAALLGPRAPFVDDPAITSDEDPLAPPTLPAGLDDRTQERMARDYAMMLDALGQRRPAHALAAVVDWSDAAVDGAGQDFALLLGRLEVAADLPDDAIYRLRPLAADAAYVERRPSTLYYYARALYNNAAYQAGMREMRRYLDATK